MSQPPFSNLAGADGHESSQPASFATDQAVRSQLDATAHLRFFLDTALRQGWKSTLQAQQYFCEPQEVMYQRPLRGPSGMGRRCLSVTSAAGRLG